MSNAQLLLAVILGQQCLFSAVWLVAVPARLSRRAALHWAAMAALAAGSVGLIMLRGQWPAWATVALPNALMVCSFVALRRGVRIFARQPGEDRSALALALSGLIGVPLAMLYPAQWMLPGVAVAVVAISCLLLATGLDIRRHLAPEFGRAAAAWCAVPVWVLALVFVGRGVLAIADTGRVAAYMAHPAGNNLVALGVAVLFSLLLHLGLVALVVLRLVRRLQYRSDHDMLTGLLLRRPMGQLLQGEMQRQRRFGGSFALLAADLDHFKTVNDRHGHAAGDTVLKQVAQAMRGAARDVDSVARMGGEEFYVLLPGADAAGAEGVAQRLLQAVRALRVDAGDSARPLQVTMSVGLAVAQAGESVQGLQRRLDQALFDAKAAGRDGLRHAAPAAEAASATAEPAAGAAPLRSALSRP